MTKLNNKTLANVLLLSITIFLNVLLMGMFSKNLSIRSLLSHIGLFITIEVLFVLIVFRERPEVNLYTTIGLVHLLYRGVVLLCSFRREYAKSVLTRFAALWTPMVFHLVVHIWIGRITVETHSHGHEHEEGGIIWLIIGTLVAGVLIYRGEKLIHRTNHCKTHHQSVHTHCEEKECLKCEENHQKGAL